MIKTNIFSIGGLVLGADIDYLTLHARSRPSRVGQKVAVLFWFYANIDKARLLISSCYRFELLMRAWQLIFNNMVLPQGFLTLISKNWSWPTFQVPWGCCRRLKVNMSSIVNNEALCLLDVSTLSSNSNFSRPPWRDGTWLDCIITDPPYGIRETTYKVRNC